MHKRIILALALAGVFAAGAAAQQFQPVDYVADFTVRPGMEEQFMALIKKYDEPLFEKLMAEGAVLAWGVDTPLLHSPGAPTHSIWWSCAEMSGHDKVFAAFAELVKKNKEEIEAARKARRPVPKTLEQEFLEVFDLANHKDWLFRSIIVGFSQAPPPAGALPYSWITITKVLPGKSEEYRKLWEEYNKPVYEKLLAAGSINAYGLGVEEARTSGDFTHFTWVSLPNLAARDTVRDAIQADRQARSAADRSIITHSFVNVTDQTATRTIVLRAAVFHVAPPPQK